MRRFAIFTRRPIQVTFWAHSGNEVGRRHALRDHLSSVAGMAEGFAGDAEWRREAELAGSLHDLGKYGDAFQRRLEGQESGLDHWSQGAWVACVEHRSVAAALAIQGHHLGLQSIERLRRSMPDAKRIGSYPDHLKLSESDPGLLKQRFADDGLVVPTLTSVTRIQPRLDDMLDVRRLFSTLVDADYLDTEAHFQGNANGKCRRAPAPELRPDAAFEVLRAHVAGLNSAGRAPRMQPVREALFTGCVEAGARACGLYTLTAPTGSGKTLAMLAFALRHAATHGLRRVVMVIPYLSIIEQTARIYREIFEPQFGADYVLEHHSLAGLGAEHAQTDAEGSSKMPGMGDAQRRRQQQTENWDAPLIVTTSVQMLESLFSNRPSACRKLHRLSDSVILFDEVQTLPTQLAVPTLATLSHLVSGWRSTVLFATATQPAFDAPVVHDQVGKHCASGWQPAPLIRTALTTPRRVRWDWREQVPLDADALAQQLRSSPPAQTLSILNTKAVARAAFEALMRATDAPVRHLSTNLCPLHRTAVLDEVRHKLKAGAPVHLVATQCIEAGVDVDFPEVWRAFAPLDALIQAAGRCNRNSDRDAPGRMVVFAPEHANWPDRRYEQAAQATQTLLALRPQARDNPEAPDIIRAYYELLYSLRNIGLDAELDRAVKERDFAEVARHYKLIKQDSISVLVPYVPALDPYRRLLDEADKRGIGGRWMRDARGLTVALYRPKPDDAAWDSLVPLQQRQGREVRSSEGWFTVAKPEHYHADLGLNLPRGLNHYIA